MEHRKKLDKDMASAKASLKRAWDLEIEYTRLISQSRVPQPVVNSPLVQRELGFVAEIKAIGKTILVNNMPYFNKDGRQATPTLVENIAVPNTYRRTINP
jgi:hypothetical protein